MKHLIQTLYGLASFIFTEQSKNPESESFCFSCIYVKQHQSLIPHMLSNYETILHRHGHYFFTTSYDTL